MKFHYYPETDSLSIDIDHASENVDLSRLEAEAFPITTCSPIQEG